MSSAVSDDDIRQAVLSSVELGSYPESQDAAAAEVPSNLLPLLQHELHEARSTVESQVQQLSKSSASDIDGWIAQAKRVQADIERSKITAREIVQQAEGGNTLKQRAVEASNKADLIEKEVAFNESLASILGELKSASNLAEEAKNHLVQGRLQESLRGLQRARAAASKLRRVEGTKAHGLLRSRIDSVQGALVEQAVGRSKQLLLFDSMKHCLTKGKDGQGQANLNIEAIVSILSDLDEIRPWLERLKRDILRSLVSPLLTTSAKGSKSRVGKSLDQVYILGAGPETTVLDILQDLEVLFEFLAGCVTPEIQARLSPLLMPSVLEQLESDWLNACVPTKTDEMHDFEQLLSRVAQLADRLSHLGWSGTNPLNSWVESAPKNWLAKRREIALSNVRNMLFAGIKDRKIVERVETQTVSGHDMMGRTDEDDQAWTEEWTEDNNDEDKNTTAKAAEESNEDDDASAWDEDELPASTSGEAGNLSEADIGEEEAWGWGDDEQPQSPQKLAQTKKAAPQHTNGTREPATAPVRELTLKETYTVTAVPDGVVKVIQQIVSDAQTLADPSFASTPVAIASSALYNLPTLMLAMYRATAPTSYSRLDSGNMLIYNDSMRLADELRAFIAAQIEGEATSSLPMSSRASSRLRLDSDIKYLDTFAKRAYSAEMESQRTILRDLLDGAQGFSNCTVPPYTGECDGAVAQTVDRLREVYRQWQPILSHSALMQSIGSLLGTATAKMLLDIEDLTDIGEEESKRLKSYCDSVSSLRDIFIQAHPSGEGSGDMTGIYCPNWFKFQYLAEILEASLADIKYLWTEGELSLEFTSDEIADLIEALFADSDYRRKAIADIRRNSRQ